jgi:hypothetical protein
VNRLQEVGLADTVLSDHNDEPGYQVELERGVRAKVAEGDVLDDQPARRIGMIRYT